MTPVDRLAGNDSPLASRDPELTARFVNDALPYLNQLNDRARRLTCNTVDAEDLVQETMLRAYTGFNTFSEGTNLRAWLFRIMTNPHINYLLRAHHRPSEYLLKNRCPPEIPPSTAGLSDLRRDGCTCITHRGGLTKLCHLRDHRNCRIVRMFAERNHMHNVVAHLGISTLADDGSTTTQALHVPPTDPPAWKRRPGLT